MKNAIKVLIPLAGGSGTPTTTYTIVYQPNEVISSDVKVRNDNPTTSYTDYVTHGRFGAIIFRSYLKFDLSYIPADSTVSSAAIALTCLDGSVANDTVRFYRIKAAWIEAQATWNNRITGTAWQTAGCDGENDREQTEIGTMSRLTTDADGTVKTITLPVSAVQGWIDGTFTNNGLMMKGDNETSNSSGNIYASVAATSTKRPKITITFTTPTVDYLSRAITWIKAAQDVIAVAGGVVNYYEVGSGWSGSDYKEVTGYTLSTMFDRYHVTGDADLLSRATVMANWLLTVQDVAGSWDDNVFDTGMIILGLCRAYDELSTAGYLTAAVAAGEWLLSIQEVNGSWITSTTDSKVHTYDARVAWGLLRLWQLTNDIDYKNAAILNLEWVLTQQNLAGWFASCGINAAQDAAPLTHTLSYTARGLLESGLILNDTDYINAAILTADAYLAIQKPDGSLGGGNFSNAWAATNEECLTGLAQAVILWWKLYNHTSDAKYKTAALLAGVFLKLRQGTDITDAGIYGGLWGSWPTTGAYNANRLLSWATKFLADALYMESVDGNAPAGYVNA